jgi:HD domain
MPATPSSAVRFLPHAVVATLAVVVLPAVAVSLVGAIGSVWVILGSLLLAMAVSVAAASMGAAIWARRPGSQDMVFADLMLWGWLRRVRAERRLAEARGLLGTSVFDAGGEDLRRDRRRKVLQQLAAELEAKDSYTLGHSRRVTRHSERIAGELGLPHDEVVRIRIAASVHDVGKVHTPRGVLTKPGRLTDDEFEIVKRHAVDGAEMVADLGDAAIAAMVRHHHERLDGSGYPDALTGDDIPLGARIIAVADTFDAMTSNRPYLRSYKHREALAVLSEEAERRLDPDAVEAFLKYYSGTRGVAWSAFGFAAQPRLASWAGGALSGVGGWSAPLPQNLAAIFATALAGLSFGGQATPATAASERASTPAGQGAVPDRDRRETPAGGAAGTSPVSRTAPTRDGGNAAPGRDVLDGAPNRTVPLPVPPAEGGARPIQGPSTPVPAGEPPAIEPPGIKPPAIKPPAVELPAIDPPPVELPRIELPRIEVPSVELPRVELPPIQVPSVQLPETPLGTN